MRQTRRRKDGQFLTADKRVKPVNRAHARLNKLVGIVARNGVERAAVYIQALFGQDFRAAVNGIAHAVEHPAEHVMRHFEFYGFARERRFRLRNFKPATGREKLNQRFVAVHFEHSAEPRFVRSALRNFNKFVVLNALDLFNKHERTDDLFYRPIFLAHYSSSFLSSASSRVMSA